MNFLSGMSGFDLPFGQGGGEELLVVCTPAGRVIFISGGLTLLIGEDLVGRNLNDFIADRIAATVVASAQSDTPYSFECIIGDRGFMCDSEKVEGNIHITMMPLSMDIDAFMSQNTAELVSREMNNSLALMLPVVKNLEQSSADRAQLGIMKQSIFRLMRLTRNIQDLALAKNSALVLKPVDLDAATFVREIENKLRPVMEKCGVKLTVSVPDYPLPCRVDREKLERMLLNLLSNSLIAIGDRRKISIVLSDKNENYSITVSDSGCGIENHRLKQVFMKYSAMAPAEYGGWNGAGFGLALVDAFARRHRGSLVLTSRPNEGTSACVTLCRNLDGDVMPLGAVRVDYAGEYDHMLMEFSTVLGKEFYM